MRQEDTGGDDSEMKTYEGLGSKDLLTKMIQEAKAPETKTCASRRPWR